MPLLESVFDKGFCVFPQETSPAVGNACGTQELVRNCVSPKG